MPGIESAIGLAGRAEGCHHAVVWHASYIAFCLRFGASLDEALAGIVMDHAENQALRNQFGAPRKEQRAYALAQALARVATEVEAEVVRR